MAQSSPQHRIVKLTFDDGPNVETTPRLLEQLKTAGVKATFFVLGRNIERPEGRAILKQMAADGHRIGNHTLNHRSLPKLPAAEIEQEISATANLIGAHDRGVKLFRPPFGHWNRTVEHAAASLGYRMVLWNVCAYDWRPFYRNRRWVAHTLRQVRAKHDSTVLLHDVLPDTVLHIPELIERIGCLPDTEFTPVD